MVAEHEYLPTDAVWTLIAMAGLRDLLVHGYAECASAATRGPRRCPTSLGAMATPPFDLHGLLRAVDAERQRHGLSWAALSRQVGVSSSTIRRYGEAEDAEADGVLALIRWLGVAPEDYVTESAVAGNRLSGVGCGVVRVDMELVAGAEGTYRGAQGRTRTSIQRLVDVAQRSGRTVESLTRLSDL